MLSVILFLIVIILAFSTAKTANNKGYSKIGFFIYGITAPIWSLIHINTLPDRTTGEKGQYTDKALRFNILFVITFSFSMIGILGYMSLFYYSFLWQIIILSFYIMLIVSTMLGRKYKFSIFVFSAFAGVALIKIIGRIYQLFKIAELRTYLLYSIVFSIIQLIYYLIFIYILYVYGIREKKVPIGKFNILVIIPAILKFAELILTISLMLKADQTFWEMGMATPSNIFELMFSFPAFIFLGLFYLEDSRCVPE